MTSGKEVERVGKRPARVRGGIFPGVLLTRQHFGTLSDITLRLHRLSSFKREVIVFAFVLKQIVQKMYLN